MHSQNYLHMFRYEWKYPRVHLFKPQARINVQKNPLITKFLMSL